MKYADTKLGQIILLIGALSAPIAIGGGVVSWVLGAWAAPSRNTLLEVTGKLDAVISRLDNLPNPREIQARDLVVGQNTRDIVTLQVEQARQASMLESQSNTLAQLLGATGATTKAPHR